MKKVISLLVLFALCCSFAACSSIKKPTTGEIPTSNATTTTTDPSSNLIIKQLPMYSISLPIITQTEYADDSIPIFNYTYQNIALIGPEPEVADVVILDFLNRVDSTAGLAETVLENAKVNYRADSTWSAYSFEIAYQPTRLDQSVLCLYGKSVSYSGAAHSEVYFHSVNYDLTNGQVLRLTDILIDDTAGNILCSAVLDSLSQIEDDKCLYEGYENFVTERFNKPLSIDQCWHLDSNGLTFYFSPYEIGPYSSGDIRATIPYSDLVDVLKPEFFPPEFEIPTGEILAANLTEDIYNSFTQYSEIIIDDAGQKYILYTEGFVEAVTLYAGSWSTSDGSFSANNAIYYASTLTPGDAIMLQTKLNGEIPTLYMTYCSNDKLHSYYIMLDKQTNSIRFIPG